MKFLAELNAVEKQQVRAPREVEEPIGEWELRQFRFDVPTVSLPLPVVAEEYLHRRHPNLAKCGMKPLLLAVALWLAAGVVSPAADLQDTPRDPDRLYADRERLDSAFDAASIWDARLKKDPKDFEAAWKLARACYWLGGHAAPDARRAQYERGIEAARQATVMHADRPEGHFWMAANMGAMAESFGLRAGIKYRGPVKKALETVIMLDRDFQQGSADRALGRWYLKVPRLFGGSKEKSVEHLKQSLTYDPTSLASLYFLAETYLEMDRKNEARQEAQKVVDGPIHAEWAPEDREFKQKAKALLERLR